MNNLNDLTVIIVTFKTNKVILANCIKTIKNNVKILIIENSEDLLFKDDIEKEYENVQVILSGSNLGYGAGNNLGLKNIKTRYALISNPDVEYNKDFFDKLDPYLNGKVEFSIMGASYNDHTNYLPYGTFDKKNTINNQFNEMSLKEVDWIVGCMMIFDTKNINSKNYFDENFFLYFEEVDLCRRIKIKGGKIFCNSKLLITHLGHRGSAATDPDYSIETEMFRNWHLMWSQFYYTKKYKNYFYAFFFMIGKFVRSFFKMIIFTLIYNKKKQTMYYARFMGILNSMLGKKARYRVRSLFK